MSPKKMRFMLDAIKKMKPAEALDYLYYSTNKQSVLYYSAIKSAISNATATLKVDPNMLKFKFLTIEEGRKLKRYRAGSRGGAKPRTRSYSHIKIVLVQEKQTPASSVKKETKKEANN